MRGLSPVAASRGHPSSRCAGLSPSRPLLLRSTGSRREGSATVAHGPSRSAACGILPDQGSNPCPLHWQADSQPLRHQGSPSDDFYFAHLSSEHRGSCFSSCPAQTRPSCSGDSILIAPNTQSKGLVSYLGKKLIKDASVEQ